MQTLPLQEAENLLGGLEALGENVSLKPKEVKMRTFRCSQTEKHTGIFNKGETRTQQHFQNEVNINTIVRKYQSTGMLPQINGMPPQYGDFTGLDFRAAQTKIAEATQSFAQLPANLRKRFQNDPAQLVDFIGNEDNRAEAEKLGLVKRREEKKQNVVQSPNADSTSDRAHSDNADKQATDSKK